jgi:hypothetical protein
VSALKDRLKELFPTTDPAAASRGKAGEVEAQKPPPKERRDGDYIPVVAVLVGVAILTVAFLRPQHLSPAPSAARNPETTEDSYENDWPPEGQSY